MSPITGPDGTHRSVTRAHKSPIFGEYYADPSPPAPHRPASGSAAILSLHGLADDAVARLRTTWDHWLDGQFQPNELPGEGTAS